MTSRFASEADLLDALHAGDEEAATVFVHQHTGRLLSLARRFLHNEEDAADAVQDAFLSAFKSLQQFEGNSTLGTWIHRIVVNTCLMKLRSHATRKTCSIDELLPRFDETGHHAVSVCSWSNSAYERMLSEERRTHVRACIQELPDDYRTVLLLRDLEGFDTEQTAALLGITSGTVKTRLHRARQALRTLLAPYMAD